MNWNWHAFKLTPAMQAIIGGLLTLLLGAIIAAANAGIQALTQNGSIDFLQLGGIIWAAFMAALSVAFFAYIKGHFSLLLQAGNDILGELENAATNAQAPAPTATPAPGPLVVIHTASPAQVVQAAAPAPVSSGDAPVSNPPQGSVLAQPSAQEVPAVTIPKLDFSLGGVTLPAGITMPQGFKNPQMGFSIAPVTLSTNLLTPTTAGISPAGMINDDTLPLAIAARQRAQTS